MKLETKPVLFDLEDREIVLLHQIDDGLDFFEVFEVQDALLWFEAKRLGKAVLRTRSSQRIRGK